MASTIATCGTHWWEVTSSEERSECPQCGKIAQSQVTDDGMGGFFAEQMAQIKATTTIAVPPTFRDILLENTRRLATNCAYCNQTLNAKGLCPDYGCIGSRPRPV